MAFRISLMVGGFVLSVDVTSGASTMTVAVLLIMNVELVLAKRTSDEDKRRCEGRGINFFDESFIRRSAPDKGASTFLHLSRPKDTGSLGKIDEQGGRVRGRDGGFHARDRADHVAVKEITLSGSMA